MLIYRPHDTLDANNGLDVHCGLNNVLNGNRRPINYLMIIIGLTIYLTHRPIIKLYYNNRHVIPW